MLGSGRTRLAWSAGLRELGHEVETVEADELLGAQKDESRGRRAPGLARLAVVADARSVAVRPHRILRRGILAGHLAAGGGANGRRPLLVAHTDGLELLASERLAAVAAKAAPVRPPAWRGAACALMQRVEQLAFSRSDGFVTGCELDRQYLLDHHIGNPARMEVVPLGLSAEYLDLPLRAEHENRVACLGSWIDRKGLPALVAAMTPLLRARPALGLDLFGVDTTETDPLPDFPADVHAQIVVQPKLPTPELIDRLSRARVFFFPSEYEGFGLALAEAMACGCAAVTTPTGYGAELRDGEEALLCAFGDAPAMSSAIARLLDDETLRARIAGAGHARVQGLRWESSVRKLENTYLRWLDGWRSAARAA